LPPSLPLHFHVKSSRFFFLSLVAAVKQYEWLFTLADTSKQGVLSGSDAVNFMMKAKLDRFMLKTIWSLADANDNGFLVRSEFAVAMRLIALSQTGHTPSKELLHAPLFSGEYIQPRFYNEDGSFIIPKVPVPVASVPKMAEEDPFSEFASAAMTSETSTVQPQVDDDFGDFAAADPSQEDDDFGEFAAPAPAPATGSVDDDPFASFGAASGQQPPVSIALQDPAAPASLVRLTRAISAVLPGEDPDPFGEITMLAPPSTESIPQPAMAQGDSGSFGEFEKAEAPTGSTGTKMSPHFLRPNPNPRKGSPLKHTVLFFLSLNHSLSLHHPCSLRIAPPLPPSLPPSSHTHAHCQTIHSGSLRSWRGLLSQLVSEQKA
jgi:hypothetical protein